jgi:hypothetical protein
MIVGTIKGQELFLTSPMIVADTINYLEARFAFSADWSAAEKWAHFESEGVVYDIRLTNDKILKENHLNWLKGVWNVYLHGTTPDGTRITTNETRLRVLSTGVLNGQPLPEVPLSAAEQISALATEAKQIADEVREDADAGKLDGATFTPSVSSGGIISWENDKGRPNPPPRDITGPRGFKGNGIKSITTEKKGLETTVVIKFTDADSADEIFKVRDGVGILSINKTATSGIVDTYTITFTDGNTFSFPVTNGKDGARSWNDLEDRPFYEESDGTVKTIDAKYLPMDAIAKEVVSALPEWEGGSY